MGHILSALTRGGATRGKLRRCWSTCVLLLSGLLPAAAGATTAEPDRRPFLLGGIQTHEKDHERWAASLIQAGMNGVEVTVYAHHGAWHSPNLWYSDEEPAVLDEIRAARRNGLQVVLILRVALDHNDPANRFLWHGLIHPRTEAELAEWFRRYSKFVIKWARIARAEGVEVLGLASEMNSLLATLPVEEIPELPEYYLDDAKQLELRQLVGRFEHLFDSDDRVAIGAGSYERLDTFLRERNQAERRWARVYAFAEEGEAVGDAVADAAAIESRIARINQRRRLLTRHWRDLIDDVRDVYRGRLTLAANFDNYHQIAFWDHLDLIGINAYFKLRPTLESPLREADLQQAWRDVFAEIEAFKQDQELDQDIVFTELGYSQRRGVTVAPWTATGFVPIWDDAGDSVLLWSDQPIEPEERAMAVRALHTAWRDDDLPLAGILYWKLSSLSDLERYEPFMLYVGTGSRDPLAAALTRFSEHIRPFDPLPATTGDRYAEWAAAITRGDLEAIHQLGTRRGKVKTPPGGLPPLHLAVRSGHSDVVRQLVEPARLRARDAAGYLPLHWSCYQSDPSLVALLLPPRRVSWRDDRNETPLMKCARLDNVAVMRELLRHHGARGRAREDWPGVLRRAVDLASADMIELLTDHGVAADAADSEGITAMHAAAQRGDPEIVELLARVSKTDVADNNGNRPVDYAAYFGNARAFELLWRPEAARRTSSSGQSLLHHAAAGGDAEIVGTLLRAGLEVDRVDDEGRTPLFLVAMHSHRAAAGLLLEHGATIDRVDEHGSTVLHLAASRKDSRMLRLLLARATDPGVTDADGNTPLHHAAGWGREQNVRVLLAAGARLDARNRKGHTALQIAEDQSRMRVAELLRSAAGVSAPSALGGR